MPMSQDIDTYSSPCAICGANRRGVLEHVEDTSEFLRQDRTLLKTDGSALLSTRNYQELSIEFTEVLCCII